MSKTGKMWLFNNYYEPILTYVTETWACAKTNINRLTAAGMTILRSIKCKTRGSQKRNKSERI
jgi:hypothetical protein